MSETRTPDVTEADTLLNDPIIIEHPLGRSIGLRFTNRHMVEVERIFGSIMAFERELNHVRARGLDAPILTFVVRSLDALLYDDPPAIRENRADCLELPQLGDYLAAIRRAYVQFWPVQSEPAAPNRNGALRPRKGAKSRGASGSIVPSSSSTSTPRDSGA
jgi:hypothetical protein